MRTERPLPRFIHDVLASVPRAGDGVNLWLFRSARLLHPYRSEYEIFQILRGLVINCGRRVTDFEVERAVRRSKAAAFKPGELRPGSCTSRLPKWPARDQSRINNLVGDGISLYDLFETSPIRFDDTAPHTGEIIDALFPNDCLLCVGMQKNNALTVPKTALAGKLEDLQFIVPSPMSKLEGINQDGILSARCLDNTGSRRFLVVEFDFNEKARDGVTDSEWAPLVRAWKAKGISVADACAALLYILAISAPLALVVHSGGKSLHGWFYCKGRTEAQLRPFMREAYRLGADHMPFTRCQFVRMPDGMRDARVRQVVYFFNPEVIYHGG
jgi:hypothetical protein